MMREIKFRGKTEWGTWCYGGYTKINDEKSDIWEYSASEIPTCPSVTPCTVLADTVGQYTGLKDKNGVEIYEGDILSFPVKKEPSRSFIVCFGEYTDYYTRFSQYGVYVMVSPIDDGEKCISITQTGAEDMVVIGNVHDDTELLKK